MYNIFTCAGLITAVHQAVRFRCSKEEFLGPIDFAKVFTLIIASCRTKRNINRIQTKFDGNFQNLAKIPKCVNILSMKFKKSSEEPAKNSANIATRQKFRGFVFTNRYFPAFVRDGNVPDAAGLANCRLF